MFVKRYVATDIQKAMERIRKDLGPDAYILSQRPVRKKGFFGFFQKKLVEVMVAAEDPADRAREEEKNRQDALRQAAQAVLAERVAAEKAEQKEPAPTPAVDVPGATTEQTAVPAPEITNQLEEIKGAVRELSDRMATVDLDNTNKYSPNVIRLYNELLNQSATLDLAKRTCNTMQEVLDTRDATPKKVAEDLLLDILGQPAPLKLKKYHQSIIILMGPTGVGKTTTLVKLAGKYTIEENLKVGVINTDTFRVAAQEQIKTYADIMSIPCITVYSPEEVKKTLSAMQDRDVIFIDTAGKSTADVAYHELMRAYMRECQPDEILLAVSASMAPQATQQMIENFSYLEDYKVVITKVDEISTMGHILNIADYAKKPISYLTTGQNVPQDIMEPNLGAVAQTILESAEL
ncbi:flagellar biosynthesis protein FlhF [Eubacteriales bacterium OttesenSCG-928-M02]|nr:flagellar biosynthesis protein FlhF [Eubacteriales bacterium OttesenSCG-928-M02]